DLTLRCVDLTLRCVDLTLRRSAQISDRSLGRTEPNRLGRARFHARLDLAHELAFREDDFGRRDVHREAVGIDGDPLGIEDMRVRPFAHESPAD
ncbi:MAG: hypothetical protein SGI72_15670, partial [Planctomycetota bacterium]|nr:hypothetical protein [Planctomycetota bacterium]